MPTKPTIAEFDTKNGQSLPEYGPTIMNTIRANSSAQYQELVPYANTSRESAREIGNVLFNYPALMNEYLNNLVNRIGRVLITSKLYTNPWSMLKKGMLEFGETVEEIFVNIARPFQFDPEVAETEVFKREIPDVRAAFHVMNYQKFYKDTISNDQLRQAFLSWQGITDLIARIVDSMYTAANYDEFQTMKYLIARMALNGNIYPTNIPAVNADNARTIVSTVKGVANQLEFMSSNYNMAGVPTFTRKPDQVIILDAAFDAIIDVEVLSLAFNMDKSEFMGRRILVDGFGNFDRARLDLLFKNDPAYTPITDAELQALQAIKAVQIDRDWMMVFDNFNTFTEIYNNQGLYWNYTYHVWRTFSASPFNNAVLYTTNTPGVTSVTVSPATATVSKGGVVQLSADVVTTGFASKKIVWSIAQANSTSTVSPAGLVSISADEPNATLTVTATSVYDNTKSGSSTITIPTT